MNEEKILLVIGHCETGDMGAYSETLEIFEQSYNKKVALYLKNKYPTKYDIHIHIINPYETRQSALARIENKIKYKLVVELHFNSYNRKAQGTEVLYFKGSIKGKKYAEIIDAEIVNEFGLNDRGAKPVSKGGRGYGFLRKMKAVALIIEPFFGDEEKCLIFENIPRYSETLHKAFKQL